MATIFRSPEVKTTCLVEINANELATIREGLKKILIVSYTEENRIRASLLLSTLPQQL